MKISPATKGGYGLAVTLVQMGAIPLEELSGLQERYEGDERGLREALVKDGVVSPSRMAEATARLFDVPFVDLTREKVDPAALELVPEALANRYQVLPLSAAEGRLQVAIADPGDIEALDGVATHTRKKVIPAVGVPEEIRQAIGMYYRGEAAIEEQVARLPSERSEVAAGQGHLSPEIAAQTPVTRIVDLLIEQAVKQRASDIHLEPQEESLEVRYRVDGLLHPVMSLPTSLQRSLVSRIKVLAEMDIAERRRPQDGKFSLRVGGTDIDIRVATAECACGEMVVLRLLNKSLPLFNLSELGFQTETMEKYKQLLTRKYGMLLSSGPTGSGKSTTLAAMIAYLNETMSKHVITIEDPIEFLYHSHRCLISQRELGTDTRSFATALKHALRQDPDVILLGEMRDPETAATALTAAETGHLVLTTGHAPSAPGTIDRILSLFPSQQETAERARLASVLEGVLCQALVSRRDGGGRVAAVEVILATTAVRNLIRDGKTHQLPNILRTGARQGMQAMDQALLDLYHQHLITQEEALAQCFNREELEKLTPSVTEAVFDHELQG